MKSNFTSSFYKLIIIVLVIGFLLWNIYTLIQTSNLVALLPISIQSVLAILLFTKHRWLGIGLKVWSMFFIISGALRILGQLIQSVATEMNAEKIIWSSISVILGIIIWKIGSDEIELVYS